MTHPMSHASPGPAVGEDGLRTRLGEMEASGAEREDVEVSLAEKGRWWLTLW